MAQDARFPYVLHGILTPSEKPAHNLHTNILIAARKFPMLDVVGGGHPQGIDAREHAGRPDRRAPVVLGGAEGQQSYGIAPEERICQVQQRVHRTCVSW